MSFNNRLIYLLLIFSSIMGYFMFLFLSAPMDLGEYGESEVNYTTPDSVTAIIHNLRSLEDEDKYTLGLFTTFVLSPMGLMLVVIGYDKVRGI